MIRATHITFAFVIILLFATCKKYPEDGKISFRKPVKRLMRFTWAGDLFLINGQDSSYQTYHSSIIIGGNNGKWYSFKGLQFKFSEHTDNGHVLQSFEISNGGGIVGTGSWSLLNNDNQIELSGGYNMYLFDPSPPSWKILKLTDKEFRVQTAYNSKTYEMRFTKD